MNDKPCRRYTNSPKGVIGARAYCAEHGGSFQPGSRSVCSVVSAGERMEAYLKTLPPEELAKIQGDMQSLEKDCKKKSDEESARKKLQHEWSWNEPELREALGIAEGCVLQEAINWVNGIQTNNPIKEDSLINAVNEYHRTKKAFDNEFDRTHPKK